MNYRTFKQNKLVRDKFVQTTEVHGSKLYWFSLNDQEFSKQLKLKLLEEAEKVVRTQTTQELLEELSGILEVVSALAKLHAITDQDLAQAQELKRAQQGGYDDRVFVTFAEHLKDSPQERYCLANSDKYPEVKNNQ